MNSLFKVVFDDSLKQLLCCTSPQADRKAPGIGRPSQGSREHYQRHLQALEEGKKKRDEDFAQRKAERAATRIRLREKYQLRENEHDCQKLRAVSERVEMPVELAVIVNVGKRPESGPSLLAGLPESNLSELAPAAITQLRQTTQRECTLM